MSQLMIITKVYAKYNMETPLLQW